jgi:hypothetical protein
MRYRSVVLLACVLGLGPSLADAQPITVPPLTPLRAQFDPPASGTPSSYVALLDGQATGQYTGPTVIAMEIPFLAPTALGAHQLEVVAVYADGGSAGVVAEFAVAAEQVPTDTITAGVQFQLAVDRNASNTTGYRLYRAGVLVDTIAQPATSPVLFALRTESAPGTVLYEASALNASGGITMESTGRVSLLLTVTATQPQPAVPPTPTGMRVIRP